MTNLPNRQQVTEPWGSSSPSSVTNGKPLRYSGASPAAGDALLPPAPPPPTSFQAKLTAGLVGIHRPDDLATADVKLGLKHLDIHSPAFGVAFYARGLDLRADEVFPPSDAGDPPVAEPHSCADYRFTTGAQVFTGSPAKPHGERE